MHGDLTNELIDDARGTEHNSLFCQAAFTVLLRYVVCTTLDRASSPNHRPSLHPGSAMVPERLHNTNSPAEKTSETGEVCNSDHRNQGGWGGGAKRVSACPL